MLVLQRSGRICRVGEMLLLQLKVLFLLGLNCFKLSLEVVLLHHERCELTGGPPVRNVEVFGLLLIRHRQRKGVGNRNSIKKVDEKKDHDICAGHGGEEFGEGRNVGCG